MGVARHVGEVGDPAEHAFPAPQFKGPTCCTHRTATGQRQDDPFAVSGDERVNTARFQLQHPQARTVPAGPPGIDVDGVRPARGAAGREVEPVLVLVLTLAVGLLLAGGSVRAVGQVLAVGPVLVGVIRRHGPSLPGWSSDTAVSTARATSPSTG